MVEDMMFDDDLEQYFSFPPWLDCKHGEFTIADVMKAYNLSEWQAAQRCKELVQRGVLESGIRYDPRIKRRVTGFWKKR